ncbi:MAG: AIR synthase-related protein, partial [Verrucomicrobiota bacterium]|nr:AIR synthase-related protein [Verrucomicrobiota bacterium]
AVIMRGTWEVLPIFDLIKSKGKVTEAEMHQVFNMGIGMVAIVRGEDSKSILRTIHANKLKAWDIGFIDSGNCQVQLS